MPNWQKCVLCAHDNIIWILSWSSFFVTFWAKKLGLLSTVYRNFRSLSRLLCTIHGLDCKKQAPEQVAHAAVKSDKSLYSKAKYEHIMKLPQLALFLILNLVLISERIVGK